MLELAAPPTSVLGVVRDLGLITLAGKVLWDAVRRPRDRMDREHGVRFEALHTQRVRIIGEMYRLLSVSTSKLEWATDSVPADDEIPARVGEWSKTANEFFEYYDQHRIWLPTTTCTGLDNAWAKLKEAGYMAIDSTVPRKTVSRSDARNFIHNEFKSARAELDNEFRSLLGTIHPETSA